MESEENRPFLIIYKGALAGTRWPLENDTTTIGRGSDCDLVMLERQISRYHARIEHDERGYLLRDLGSKNGTFVNDKPVRKQPYRLRDGDEINLAMTVQMGFVAGDATLPLESEESISLDASDALSGASEASSKLQVHLTTRRVCLGREELDPPLSPAQFALLDLLVSSDERVVTRQEIIQVVWPDAVGGVTDQAVDALVYRLRERLAELNPDHEYVVTVRGHGLRFEQDE